MRSEKILKNIRTRAIILISLGSLLFLGTGFLSFCCFVADGAAIAIPLLISSLLGLFVLIIGIRWLNPKNSLVLKNNPDILKWTDDLYSNITYENETYICSKKYIASKKNPLLIAAFDEILCYYERTITYRYGIKQYDIVIVTKRGDVVISSMKKNSDSINELKELFKKMCPHVKIGCTNEENKEYRKIQKEFKKNLK